MLEYYITVLLRQFTNTLNQFCYLCRVNENLATCIPAWSEQLKELKQLWGTFTGYYFDKWTLPQKYKTSCSMKTTTYSHTILCFKVNHAVKFLFISERFSLKHINLAFEKKHWQRPLVTALAAWGDFFMLKNAPVLLA